MKKIIYILYLTIITTISCSQTDKQDIQNKILLQKTNDSLKINLGDILLKIDSFTVKDHVNGMKIRNKILPLQWDIYDFHEKIEKEKLKTVEGFSDLKIEYQEIMMKLLDITKNESLQKDYEKYKQTLEMRLKENHSAAESKKLYLTKLSNDIYILNLIIARQLISETLNCINPLKN